MTSLWYVGEPQSSRKESEGYVQAGKSAVKQSQLRQREKDLKALQFRTGEKEEMRGENEDQVNTPFRALQQGKGNSQLPTSRPHCL